MVFAAGEEISWGQRIFGLATPDFLIGLNSQDELNVHNISTRAFGNIYSYGALLLCMVTGAASLCRKDRLFGIPLPSILLMLGFILMLSQRQGSLKSIQWFSFYNEQFLVLFLFIYALVSRQAKLGVATASAMALILVLAYVNDNSIARSDSIYEVREYLLGIVCLFYACELLLTREPARRKIVAPFSTLKLTNGLKLTGKEIPVLLTVCSLVIVSSIGLAFFNYFSVRTNDAIIAEDHRSIMSGELGEPAIRSSFDVYLTENRLIYFREQCAPDDTKEAFFLHIVPADANDLPNSRREAGFNNHDFYFDRHRRTARLDGSCLVSNPLPDYGIASIRTGQYISSSGEIWSGSIVLNPDAAQ